MTRGAIASIAYSVCGSALATLLEKDGGLVAKGISTHMVQTPDL